jgi:hypothetical protein
MQGKSEEAIVDFLPRQPPFVQPAFPVSTREDLARCSLPW